MDVKGDGYVLRQLCKIISLFLAGGTVYACLELLCRGGHTHWSMFVLGGALFLLLGKLGAGLPPGRRALLGAAAVTLAELAAGLTLNLWLGLAVWDYSALPLNLLGQVCLPYALLWIPVSAAGAALNGWLRYTMWGEPRRHCAPAKKVVR